MFARCAVKQEVKNILFKHQMPYQSHQIQQSQQPPPISPQESYQSPSFQGNTLQTPFNPQGINPPIFLNLSSPDQQRLPWMPTNSKNSLAQTPFTTPTHSTQSTPIWETYNFENLSKTTGTKKNLDFYLDLCILSFFFL